MPGFAAQAGFLDAGDGEPYYMVDFGKEVSLVIVHTYPPQIANDVAPGTMVLVYSDAPDNPAAILETEQWCRANGFVRAQELWLTTVSADDKVLRKARCYRAYEQELDEAAANCAAMDAHRDRQPLTESSVAITRG